MILHQRADLGKKSDSDSPIVLQHPIHWQSTPILERYFQRIVFVEAKANVQQRPFQIPKTFKMKTGQIGQSVLGSVEGDIRSEWNRAILQIPTVSDRQPSLRELATLNLVLEIGDAGQHGLSVTGITRRGEAESASDRMEFEAENPPARFVRQDPDLKRSTVTDGVRGRNGKAIARAVLTDLGSELALAKLKNATDRTEKRDLATDQCPLFPFPLRCRSTWSSALVFPVSFSELWLEPHSSFTTWSIENRADLTAEVRTMCQPNLKTFTSLSRCLTWNTNTCRPIRVIAELSGRRAPFDQKPEEVRSTARRSTATTRLRPSNEATAIEIRVSLPERWELILTLTNCLRDLNQKTFCHQNHWFMLYQKTMYKNTWSILVSFEYF